MNDFTMTRLGVMMEPQPGNAQEVEGVLNPAAARGRDGELYLFPRLIAHQNFSRIGIARVLFNKSGDPTGVERLGIALEPETDYEIGPNGLGGCEDARVTYLEPAGHYVMTYTALTAQGPRIAVAISSDLFHWRRLGLARFTRTSGVQLGEVDDKDACAFPLKVPNPDGVLELALLHRPLFPGTRPEEKARNSKSHPVNLDRESIWISYANVDPQEDGPRRLHQLNSHRRLASPLYPWERLKIGCGTPPVLTRHGWLIIYHGVGQKDESKDVEHSLCYSAGVMILSSQHPSSILYRSPEPVLTPELPEEFTSAKGGVVFPTGIDRRDDIGQPDRYDVYYGMADNKIGVARLELPETLPEGTQADLQKDN
jgi:predicted GH43/DUF377 family glycosyl hydrolase